MLLLLVAVAYDARFVERDVWRYTSQTKWLTHVFLLMGRWLDSVVAVVFALFPIVAYLLVEKLPDDGNCMFFCISVGHHIVRVNQFGQDRQFRRLHGCLIRFV